MKWVIHKHVCIHPLPFKFELKKTLYILIHLKNVINHLVLGNTQKLHVKIFKPKKNTVKAFDVTHKLIINLLHIHKHSGLVDIQKNRSSFPPHPPLHLVATTAIT